MEIIDTRPKKEKAEQKQGKKKTKLKNYTLEKNEEAKNFETTKTNRNVNTVSSKSRTEKKVLEGGELNSGSGKKQSHTDSRIFHSRQTPSEDSCRMHALNAFFGYAKLSKISFSRYCDQFDKLNKLHIGTTKEYFTVMENGDTIFSFIIQEIFKSKNSFDNQPLHKTLYLPKNTKYIYEELENTDNNFILDGYFEFTDLHVWYTKRLQNDNQNSSKWFLIDSIEKKVKIYSSCPIDIGLGHIIVWTRSNEIQKL